MVSSAQPIATVQHQPPLKLAGNGARPNRLSPSSPLTPQQKAYAQYLASGLHTAAMAYRKAYGKSTTRPEPWCRVAAYDLARLPHVAAEIARLKAEYDAVRPSLTRSSKREILHGMAVDEQLDPPDRQRAIDLDNRMQGEYQERVEVTHSVSLFRGAASPGSALAWQLAEEVPQLVSSSTGSVSEMELAPDQSSAAQARPAAGPGLSTAAPAAPASTAAPVPAQPPQPLAATSNASHIHAEAAASSPTAEPAPGPAPLAPGPQSPAKRRKSAPAKPLTPEQIQALRVLPAERAAARRRAQAAQPRP